MNKLMAGTDYYAELHQELEPCSNCGRILEDDWNLCPICGWEHPEATRQLTEVYDEIQRSKVTTENFQETLLESVEQAVAIEKSNGRYIHYTTIIICVIGMAISILQYNGVI